MNTYYQTAVSFTIESDNGKLKKQTVLYLVDAQSCTEAEARVTRFLNERGETNFEVKAVMESKIAEVVTL
jgi:hypothetical protein